MDPIRPRYRGKMLCFGYLPMYSPTEPLFTIGPDYLYSVAELGLFNFLMYLPYSAVDYSNSFQIAYLWVLIF